MTRSRDENGMALVAALLVMMVCSILVAGSLALASHTALRSGFNRDHSAALHAAEAGIEADLATLSAGGCPALTGTETVLPDSTLVKASYKIVSRTPCTAGGNAVVTVVGYAPNATKPVATATIVAHINRGQGASVSTGNAGGYVFPDAIYTNGTLDASAGLSLYGVGGTVPSTTANGNITVTDTVGTGQLDGPVQGWKDVNISGAEIGGAVVGATVAGSTVTMANARVQGDVTTGSGVLDLASTTTVNGNVRYGGTKTAASPTVTGTGPTFNAYVPTTQRPMPVFTDSTARTDIPSLLPSVGSSVTASCPGAGLLTFYDFTAGGTCNYNPASIGGTVVVIAHGGTLNVTIPANSSGQLYVVNDAGGVNITGSGSPMPVFAFASGLVNLSGAFVGQVAGGSIKTTAGTTMTFFPPSVPLPDFAFPGGYSSATLAYAATVAYQYQCPGTTTC